MPAAAVNEGITLKAKCEQNKDFTFGDVETWGLIAGSTESGDPIVGWEIPAGYTASDNYLDVYCGDTCGRLGVGSCTLWSPAVDSPSPSSPPDYTPRPPPLPPPPPASPSPPAPPPPSGLPIGALVGIIVGVIVIVVLIVVVVVVFIRKGKKTVGPA